MAVCISLTTGPFDMPRTEKGVVDAKYVCCNHDAHLSNGSAGQMACTTVQTAAQAL
jgi:hypothetical protein